jgi:hypothetical protein
LGTQSALAGHHLPQFAHSDDALGYHFAFVALPGALSKAQTQSITDLSMPVVVAAPNSDNAFLAEWMKSHQVDFALVRPDKIVFAAGKAADLTSVLRQLAQWVNYTYAYGQVG